MNELRKKWNHRHRDTPLPKPPCAVLQEQAARLPASPGTALDLACGLGGNAVFLAERGWHCEAWDISDVALQRLDQYAQQHQLPITSRVANLDNIDLSQHSFDVIVVSYFLSRPLLPALALALKPGGMLFYQTFLAAAGKNNGPGNPAFILQKGELPSQTQSLQLCYYEERSKETKLDHSGADLALMVAQKLRC